MKETAYPPQEGDHRSPDDVVVVVVDDVVDDDDDDDDDENLNNHGGKVDIHNLHPSCDNDLIKFDLLSKAAWSTSRRCHPQCDSGEPQVIL